MKKISLLFISVLLVGFFSCHNEDREFPDFDYTTAYFPYQYPIRTLVLGDYPEGDNTNDNKLIFEISAHIGGMYENTKTRTVDFEVAPSLASNVATLTKDTLRLLPSAYYTLNPTSQITIPKGKFYAGFQVQLKEAFLDDSMAYRICYALPVKITGSTLDSILRGSTLKTNPDPRVSGDWNVPPKDFTLFGIKFINAYHGKYLHRGRSIIKDNLNVPLDTMVYRTKFVENNEIWALKTIGKNTVTVSGTVRANPSPGKFAMDLTFNSSGDCVITKNNASAFDVTGTGKFVKGGDSFGNKPRNTIHLAYQITVGTDTHNVTDTLVVRDRDVRFESFSPVVYQ